MSIFVPCSAIGPRRFVCAYPLDPCVRVVAFKTAGAALEAARHMTAGPWTLCADEAPYDVQMDKVSVDIGDVLAWETDIASMAASGLAGPSGFGVDVCDVVDGAVRMLESFTVEFETLDYESVRARLELEVRSE